MNDEENGTGDISGKLWACVMKRRGKYNANLQNMEGDFILN